MRALAKAGRILLRILLGISALPFVLTALYILFEIVGAAVNHAAGGIQTDRFAEYAEEKGFEIIGTDTFVGNSGNGNHVDLITKVFVKADCAVEDAEAAVSSYEGIVEVYKPDGDELAKAEIAAAPEEVLTLWLFCSAPFADNIEGH